MPTDFRDASSRHWEDAEHLLADTRLATVDHMVGVSAECAMKAVMLSLGMAVRPGGTPVETQHTVHINDLWDEFITFANARGGSRYAAPLEGQTNPFNNWNISQRYNNRMDFRNEVVQNHRRATQQVLLVLQTAILDGSVI